MIAILIVQEGLELPAVEIDAEVLDAAALNSLRSDLATAARKSINKIAKRTLKRQVQREVTSRLQQRGWGDSER